MFFALNVPRLFAEPTSSAASAFSAYVSLVEARVIQQHRSQTSFLAGVDSNLEIRARLRRGDVILERLTPPDDTSTAGAMSGAMLHHWRGTAFAPGATAADFERLMRDFSSYPQHFAPQVLLAGVTAQHGDSMQATMRVRQHHVITVVMDTAYDVRFGRLDLTHGYSISQSTRVTEIASPGTRDEHALGPAEEHGFLWRLNTYWSYEERDGGLYMQIETVSLTRAVPRGLGWAVGPYVESIPRESLEFTLRSACNAIRR